MSKSTVSHLDLFWQMSLLCCFVLFTFAESKGELIVVSLGSRHSGDVDVLKNFTLVSGRSSKIAVRHEMRRHWHLTCAQPPRGEYAHHWHIENA